MAKGPFSKRRKNTLCMHVCTECGEAEREWALGSSRRACGKLLSLSLPICKWEHLGHREDSVQWYSVKTQNSAWPSP